MTSTLANRDDNLARIKEAVSVAQGADKIVLVLGGNGATSREGWAKNHLGDREELGSIAQQNDLARRCLPWENRSSSSSSTDRHSRSRNRR